MRLPAPADLLSVHHHALTFRTIAACSCAVLHEQVFVLSFVHWPGSEGCLHNV
jgi:hypothetical protein